MTILSNVEHISYVCSGHVAHGRIGFLFGYWLAFRQIEPEYEKLLRQSGELRSDLLQNKTKIQITFQEMKEKCSSKLEKLKSKLKKAKKC